MTFRADVIWQEAPQFAAGLANTVWLCGVAMVLSLLLGVLWLAPLTSRRPAVRRTAQALVDGGRCVPFLLLAYIVYFALPAVGIVFDKWTAALATLVLYNAAYMAEILRAGWTGIAPEQMQAGRAFGYTGFLLLRRIMLPQVLLAVGPLIGNQLIQLIKDSAFLSIITVPELTFAANYVQSYYFIPFESFLVATLLYWMLCGGVEWLVRRSDRWASLVRRGHA
jgi:polar amino acid transport system permease protein